MKIRVESLFPNHLSDEAAAALCDFLQALAGACESRYLTQLHRHHAGQLNLYDPESPWRSPVAKQ